MFNLNDINEEDDESGNYDKSESDNSMSES
jgi:hypothetical protein